MAKPEIRLKGFEGEWMKTSFGEMAQLRRGLTYSPSYIRSQGIRVLRSSNIDEDNFSISDDDVFVTKECVNIPLANDGDILITAANGSPRLVGKHCIITNTTKSPMVHGGFMLLASSKESDFVNASMGSSWFRDFQRIGIAGGNGAIGNLNKNELELFVFLIPEDKRERDAIADYFKSLDSMIQATTKKIASLKQMKSASLISMFPQAGENTPRVRFKGFEGDWMKTSFGKMAQLRRGLTYSPSDIRPQGIRVLRSSNIDEDKFSISDDDVFVTKECVNIPLANDGDILITAANGSPRLVGKHCIIKNTKESPMVHGGFMLLASSKESDFVNASMGSSWFRDFQRIGIAGGNGAIGNLNKNELELFEFLVPNNKRERDAIGSYFRSLDKQISLQEQRLEKLKQIKSACLDKMFV